MIRKQIKACALTIPVISRHTYGWKLVVDRDRAAVEVSCLGWHLRAAQRPLTSEKAGRGVWAASADFFSMCLTVTSFAFRLASPGGRTGMSVILSPAHWCVTDAGRLQCENTVRP